MGVAQSREGRGVSCAGRQSRISFIFHTPLAKRVQGYSYGALIASLHPVLPIRTMHILLSYPLGPRGLLTAFRTQTYKGKLRELVQDASAHVLILFGGADEFTGEGSYDAWAEELSKEGRGLQIEKIKHGTHFWAGEPATKMCEIIQKWLK
jgi:pimeloyl-ACP methyl ester carboxylesterase